MAIKIELIREHDVEPTLEDWKATLEEAKKNLTERIKGVKLQEAVVNRIQQEVDFLLRVEEENLEGELKDD